MRKAIPKSLNAAHLLNEQLIQEDLHLTEKEQTQLQSLYHGEQKFSPGTLLKGKVLKKDSDGVLVDIGFKSYGLINNYEFNRHELSTIAPESEIEVLLDRLEDESGSIVVSYQKAKSARAWDKIIALAQNDEPVVGVVTSKVKGGLSVDIGIPAFLPGSQVDVQRVMDFDQFLGQEVTCKILKVNKKRGNVIVSRRKFLEVARQESKTKVLETLHVGDELQGIAKNITNYGVFVDVGGVDGLLHITDMSWGRVNHPSELIKIGDTLNVKVIALDKENEKISLGMKQLLSNPWDNVEKTYTVGSKIKGTVSSITDYGLFVEIKQGIEGLVHISEVSWTERISNLSKYFTTGQVIEVLVVAVDKENRRMSLSIKQLSQDPWLAVTEKFKAGDKVSGKISNITDFGVFVELGDGVDGLVHVSDISWTNSNMNPNQLYTKGDVIDAMVLDIDSDTKKIALGIKQLSQDPWSDVEQLYPVDSIIEGTVSKHTNFGTFVRLGNGIEGLVHISELPKGSNDEVEKIDVGTVRQFRVIKVNSDERKLGLSVNLEKRSEEKRAPAKQRRESNTHHQADTAPTQIKSVLQRALEEHAARNQEEE